MPFIGYDTRKFGRPGDWRARRRRLKIRSQYLIFIFALDGTDESFADAIDGLDHGDAIR